MQHIRNIEKGERVMKSKILFVCMGIVLSLAGCGNREKEIEVSELMGSYTIDVHSYEELAGYNGLIN